MSKKTETKGSASVNKETGAQKKTLTGRILAKKTNLIVFAAIAVAVFVLVNLLAQFIPNIDNTTGGIFTLTDTTKKTLSELNKDVTIYAKWEADQQADYTIAIWKQLASDADGLPEGRYQLTVTAGIFSSR